MKVSTISKIGALAVGALALSPLSAKALPVDTELMLLIDASGSISNSDFDLQVNAYENSLNSLLPTNGRATVGVWLFGANVVQIFAPTIIDDAGDKTALISALQALNATTRGGVNTGATAIGDAINTALAALSGLGNLASATIDQIIDVSTDGFNNIGADENTAAANAVTAGVEQVNCIGIGGSADCGFIAGSGSFSLAANDFADFSTALDLKLQQELNVPEPMAIALFGLGLLGVGAVRRRKAA